MCDINNFKKLKSGDKIYCTKNNIQDNKIVHKSGKFYTVDVMTNYGNGMDIYLTCEANSMPHNYYGYILIGDLYNDFLYLSDYFGDLKVIRKEKLENLFSKKY